MYEYVLRVWVICTYLVATDARLQRFNEVRQYLRHVQCQEHVFTNLLLFVSGLPA
jgi:sensor histidine kinase regulating citrate/malate metabolism